MEMKPEVSIRCTVYNHEPYLRECLNGFVMQITNFMFEALVHDDASTDNSANIIREYADKYPEIIKPIFESENQYSKRDGTLQAIMDTACDGKYVAWCEGDDYWTDPYKLQKQYDFMESHPDCSLCFCSHSNLFPDGSMVEVARYNADKIDCPAKDVILGGGAYMASNSMFLRNKMFVPYRKWAGPCSIGDYPTVLSLLAKGKIAFLRDCMCVYRRDSIGSWSERQKTTDSILKAKEKKTIVRMLLRYNNWTRFKYFRWIMVVVFDVIGDCLKLYSLKFRIKFGLSKMKKYE